MKRKVVHEVADLDSRVTLIQNSPRVFTVKYGQQTKSGLTYGEAAKEYGECIMHSAAACGLIVDEEAA